MTISRRDRIEGAFLGLLVGSAVGAPYAFKLPAMLPPTEVLDPEPPETFKRSHPEAVPGTWTEGAAQALCLLESVQSAGRLDSSALSEGLLRWLDEDAWQLGEASFPVDLQTLGGLKRLRKGVAPLEAGGTRDIDTGNGGLIRGALLALWHPGTDAELVRDSRAQSCLTHAHPRSQLASALQGLWLRRLLEGRGGDAWTLACAGLAEVLHQEATDEVRAEMVALTTYEGSRGLGSSEARDSLHSAVWAFDQGGFATAVRAAISLGVDTDATAGLTGAAAGASAGVTAIPSTWRDRLQGAEIFGPLLESFR